MMTRTLLHLTFGWFDQGTILPAARAKGFGFAQEAGCESADAAVRVVNSLPGGAVYRLGQSYDQGVRLSG